MTWKGTRAGVLADLVRAGLAWGCRQSAPGPHACVCTLPHLSGEVGAGPPLP